MYTLIQTLLAPILDTHLISAIAFLRIAMGLLSIGHGWPKIAGGRSTWNGLGKAIANVGITFAYTFWGFLAAFTEFFGGIALVLGLGTRVATALLSITMLVAFVMHKKKGDPFMVYSFSLSLLVVYLFFMYVGSGPFSLDAYITN